ncbi:MAG: hypothetical protein H7Y22_01130, partial [Gemmatimonadaceae bacterium]|nr:hypothetical protein [Gloeobacterales cyanobacterium ES-bin-141]
MADGKEVLNNGHKADTAVQPLDSPLPEKPPAPELEEPQEAEEPMESTGFNRRIDSAKKTQAGWNRMFETFVAPLIMEESVLHPEGREVNPSRLYMLIGGAGLGVLGVAAWGFLSIPRANPDTALAARQRLAVQAGPTQPQQPLPLRPAQPQLPVQPIPTLQPVMQPQQQPGTPQQAMQPRPQGGQVQQRPVLQAGISRNSISSQTMTDE